MRQAYMIPETPDIELTPVRWQSVLVAEDVGKDRTGKALLDCVARYEPAINAQRFLANSGGPKTENKYGLEKVDSSRHFKE
jgi:hypothetical protein